MTYQEIYFAIQVWGQIMAIGFFAVMFCTWAVLMWLTRGKP